MPHLLACLSLAAALLLTGCGQSPESLITSARESLAGGDTAGAIIHLRNALAKEPGSATARVLLGKALLHRGDPVGANTELRKGMALGFPRNDVIPAVAQAMLAQGLVRELLGEFGSTVLDDPAAAAALKTSLAAAHLATGDLAEAEEALQQALAARPDLAAAQVLRVRMLAGGRDFEGALALMAKVLEQHPKETLAWRVHADLLRLLKGDLAGALESYRKAIALDRYNIEAHAGALSILFALNNTEAQNKQLADLRSVAPSHPQTRFFEAQAAFRARDFTRANALLQDLLRVAPDDVRTLQLAGATELQIGALAQAETHLARALQLAPQLPLGRQLLARTHLRASQPGKAIAVLAPALGPAADAATLALAAEAQLKNGDPDKAEQLFRRAAKLDPRDVRSRTPLALASIHRGQIEQGLEELRKLAADEKDTTADIALISSLLVRRQFDAAMKAIDALEKTSQDKAFMASLRGRALLLAGDRAAARRMFEQALVMDPKFFPPVSSLAALDLVERKPERALERIEKVVKADPRNAQAVEALIELKSLTRAPSSEITALLEAAVKASPGDVASRLRLIDHHLRSQRPNPAITQAQEGLATQRDNPELLDALGRAQMAAGDFNQAVSAFGRLTTAQPNSARAFVRLAEAQAAASSLDMARQSLTRALSLAPGMLGAHQGLVAVELAARRPQQALAVALALRKVQPKEALSFVLEGDIERAGGNLDAAARAYRRALELARTPATAVSLHAVLLQANKGPEADRFAQSWLAKSPRDALFLSHLGQVDLERADLASAEARYRAVLKLRGDDVIALNNVAWTMTRQGKRGASAFAERAYRLNPDRPEIMDTLAMALAEEGRFDDAIEIQQKVLRLRPEAPEHQLSLAAIYVKAGRKRDAATQLNALAKLGGNFAGQAEVARLQEELQRR